MGEGDQSLTRRELKHSQISVHIGKLGGGQGGREAAQRTEGGEDLHKYHPSCVAKTQMLL